MFHKWNQTQKININSSFNDSADIDMVYRKSCFWTVLLNIDMIDFFFTDAKIMILQVMLILQRRILVQQTFFITFSDEALQFQHWKTMKVF